MANHLGNVLVTVSDKRLVQDNYHYTLVGLGSDYSYNADLDAYYYTPGAGVYAQTSGGDGVLDWYTPDVLSYSDYYAFGAPQTGRNGGDGYRYGFNGKESDDEVKGVKGSHQDYGMRMYDPRVGRFFSADPLMFDYPFYTPYQFAGNMPIYTPDLDGAEPLNKQLIAAYEAPLKSNESLIWDGPDAYIYDKGTGKTRHYDYSIPQMGSASQTAHNTGTKLTSGNIVVLEVPPQAGGGSNTSNPEVGPGQSSIPTNSIFYVDKPSDSSPSDEIKPFGAGAFSESGALYPGWSDYQNFEWHEPSKLPLTHRFLDYVAFVPAVGSGFSCLNACIYAGEGDYENMAWSLAAAIPFEKIGVGAVKIAVGSRFFLTGTEKGLVEGEKLWKVGPYNELKGSGKGLEAHHVGQAKVMENLIPDYMRKTGPSILIPKMGHTLRGPMGTVSRNTSAFTSARQVLARDILELRRVYPGIPNSALQDLIQLNKQMYPEAFIKRTFTF